VSKYFKGGGVGGLMIFSSFFSIVLLPIIIFFDRTAFSVDLRGGIILLLAGLCNAFAIYLYLLALNEDESSVVVPFMQLIPVFTFIFGYWFLGEILTSRQIVGGIIIILGAAILSIESISGQPIRIKIKIVLLMTAFSALFALYSVFFKLVSVNDGFWTGAFWEAIGLIISGFVFFAIKSYRQEFFQVFKENSKAILSLNLANEAITIVGNWITTFASLFVSVALISLISGYQPLFVFIIGIVITVFLPKIGEEDISRRALIQKGVAIFIVILGTYFLS
jgi:drug/metabolite transporter (DMT)-like permease